MIKCTFENGHPANLRHVTVDALIIKEGKILLVKRQANVSIEPEKFVLPGGYLERDESAEEGILREVLEETGYQTEIDKLFRIIHSPRIKGDDCQNVGFFYLVNPLKKVNTPDDEIDSVQWFAFDQLPPEDKIGFDHLETITLLIKHLANPQRLPIIS